MGNETKEALLREITRRYGPVHKLDRSYSLYEAGGGRVRIYIRYSRIHSGNRAFYGLRREDLQRLQGHPSLLCLLWERQSEPLLVPLSEYEEVFESTSPASDGQYKVMVYIQDDGTEFYVAKAGRFNVEGHFGWGQMEILLDSTPMETVPELSHSQIQTLLGGIGAAKGYDVWIPQADRPKLDWSLTECFKCRRDLVSESTSVENILTQVDVIWIRRGSNRLGALFEVEHSTPIYSGLLRLNDIHVAAPSLRPKFSVVAGDSRKSLFVRQLCRPTFRASGLSQLCSFLEYANVYSWHNRVESARRRNRCESR